MEYSHNCITYGRVDVLGIMAVDSTVVGALIIDLAILLYQIFIIDYNTYQRNSGRPMLRQSTWLYGQEKNRFTSASITRGSRSATAHRLYSLQGSE